MSVKKEDVLTEILRLAKAAQRNAAEKCVELKAGADLTVCPEKSQALQDVADAISARYDVTFPADLRTLGTIDEAAQYVVDNTDR
jgi:hypothetical protein